MNTISRRIDSDLGSWTHTEWRPGTDHPLSRVVQWIWDFEGRTTHRRERVFPSGAVELIVQLDERYRDVNDGVTRLTPSTCVTGIQTGPMMIEGPQRSCRVLGVRLHPQGAWAVLEHPLSELTGTTADLEQLLGSAAGELASLCHDADSSPERVQRTIAWLCGRLHRSTTAPHLSRVVRWVADRITDAGGAVQIGPLRAETGWSNARLASKFMEQIGITPKRYARLLRFHGALLMVHAGSLRLPEIALRAGYYDQPHLNAEFRELAGLTPGQLLAAPRYPVGTSTAES